MTLQAPEHLRGPLRKRPIKERQQVYAWIIDRTREGYPQHEIATALGLLQSTVCGILIRQGVSRPKKGKARKLCQVGIKIGEPGRAINAMPEPARDALIRKAARTGLAVSEVLAAFWTEHHGAAA